MVAAFIGLGASTCAEFAEMYRASPAQTERAFYSWAQGYMSGMNDNLILLKLPPIKNLNSIPNDEKQSFLRTYCDSHPLNFYASAVTQLYISLKDAPITEDNGKKQTMPAMQK